MRYGVIHNIFRFSDQSAKETKLKNWTFSFGIS